MTNDDFEQSIADGHARLEHTLVKMNRSRIALQVMTWLCSIGAIVWALLGASMWFVALWAIMGVVLYLRAESSAKFHREASAALARLKASWEERNDS